MDRIQIIICLSTAIVLLMCSRVHGSCQSNQECQNGGSCDTSINPGNCVCSLDWTGSNCEFLADPCASAVCMHGGTCIPGSSGDFTCECRRQHKGDVCQFLADHVRCATVNCTNLGECIDEGGGNVYCQCTPFTSGAFCDNFRTCGNNNAPCRHGGTCYGGTPISCVCNSDWTGDVCELPLTCNANTCRNGGTCYPVTGDIAQCVCTSGWEGPTCEDEVLLACGTITCENGGTCDEGVCFCPPNVTGEFCEEVIDACDQAPCQNGGTCVAVVTSVTGYECECAAGFRGATCETNAPCSLSPCLNGGICIQTGSSPPDGPSSSSNSSSSSSSSSSSLSSSSSKPTPSSSSSSSSSSTPTPSPSSDSSNDNNNGYSCECPSGYGGENCDMISICDSSPCQNGGTCMEIWPGSTTTSPGLSSPSPGPSSPSPDPSSSPNTDPYFICECSVGFIGPVCGMRTPCTPNPCLNGGTCTNVNGMPSCACRSGFTGSSCENNTPSQASGLSQQTIGIIVGSAAAVIIVVIVIVAIACCCCRKRTEEDKNHLTGLELGAKAHRRNSHNYTPSPTKSLMPAIPNLRVSKMRDETKMEFPRNRLTILNKLGSGSFADVYKAEAVGITVEHMRTIVAVKRLKDTATENDKSDLSKEISLFMYLDPHPNIVNILGCCTEADPWYIIMEYLPNGNLQGYLRQIRTGESAAPQYQHILKQKDIPPNDLLNFGVQIARGMEYLASRACIHRDLAARNILLGESWVCKVSDFGLARDLEDGQTYEMKSQGRVPVRWMSPESLLHNTYTSQSDVWSFAILIWEIVTLGSHPYPGLSSKEVVKEISNGYRLPKPDHCSQDIYEMMTECWQYDPEDRPTFTQVKQKLENMLADAQGYLVMSDFNDDNYVYLEVDEHTGDTLDNH